MSKEQLKNPNFHRDYVYLHSCCRFMYKINMYMLVVLFKMIDSFKVDLKTLFFGQGVV